MKKSLFIKIALTAIVSTSLAGLIYDNVEASAEHKLQQEEASVKVVKEKTPKKSSIKFEEPNEVKKEAKASESVNMAASTASAEQSTVATPAPQTQASTSSSVTDSNSAATSYTTSTPQPTLQPDTMYIAGTAIAYANGGQGSGQAIIDSNPNGIISTWGGAPTQSGTDGMNTHFIGHNVGAFTCLLSVGNGSQIVVTDGNDTPTTYIVNSEATVDTNGIDLSTGQNLWSQITGTAGGERITLQTCLNSTQRLIVFAQAA
ncbi:MAG: sortase [Lactobacillales bacterium]|jgi:sortase (surface protein transpeptidase)|nr:sortase [Lactobacillales bacterium]